MTGASAVNTSAALHVVLIGAASAFCPTALSSPIDINDVIAAVKPRLHLCGHHHRFVETVREGVKSVCIDRINRSYLLIDANTLGYHKIENSL